MELPTDQMKKKVSNTAKNPGKKSLLRERGTNPIIPVTGIGGQ